MRKEDGLIALELVTPARSAWTSALLVVWAASMQLACGSGNSNGGPDPAGQAGAGAAASAGAGGSGGTVNAGGSFSGGTGGSIALGDAGIGAGGDAEPLPPGTLPPGYTKADVGGWKLGDRIDEGSPPPSGGGAGSGGGCGTALLAVVRDFKNDHPDFEREFFPGVVPGIVEAELPPSRKPVYAPLGPTSDTTSAEAFSEWYRSVEDVNLTYPLMLFFERNGPVFTFQSEAFFPLDEEGWGNQYLDHNFHFTTELHTEFRYKGGETFRFTGDDDLWVFINDRLAIDLGGIHGAVDEQIELDERTEELGLTLGEVYPLDFFHAERHTGESNFRVDTNLEFVDCGTVVPDPPE